MTRPRRPPPGFATALGMALSLMLLVAAGISDGGWLIPAVVLGGSAAAVGILYLLFPHGPQFALGAASGLAMYACLFAVLSRAGFPDVATWMQGIAFLLPVVAFVIACVVRRAAVSAFTADDHADLAHLPRFARWLGAVGLVGVVALSVPINRMHVMDQGITLMLSMAAIALISAVSVDDVVRLLVDIAVIFRAVTRRLTRLAVPIAAYSSLWALLSVIFGCLYRIADGFSATPIFGGMHGPIRITFSDAMHFSVITLSTVGYGDILPADDGIRVLASIQILVGQLLLLFGFVEIMRGSRAGLSDLGGEVHDRAASRSPPLPEPPAPAQAGAAETAPPAP